MGEHTTTNLADLYWPCNHVSSYLQLKYSHILPWLFNSGFFENFLNSHGCPTQPSWPSELANHEMTVDSTLSQVDFLPLEFGMRCVLALRTVSEFDTEEKNCKSIHRAECQETTAWTSSKHPGPFFGPQPYHKLLFSTYQEPGSRQKSSKLGSHKTVD